MSADNVTVQLGERTNADVALDLMKFVFSYIDDKPRSREELLNLYLRCRQATTQSTAQLR